MEYNLFMTNEELDGTHHYFVLDWDGKCLYETWCKSGERYQNGRFGDKAENAFLFWTKGSHHKGGYARLLVIDYDEDKDEDHVYAFDICISKYDWEENLVGHKVIKKHKLQDKIYLNSML